MAFEPTDSDQAFLQAYLRRKLGEPIEKVCRRAKLGKAWFFKRRSDSTGFCKWFYTEVCKRNLVRLLEVQERVLLVLEGKQADLEQAFGPNWRDLRFDPQLLKFIKEWFDPTKHHLKIEGTIQHEQVPADRSEILRQFVAYCEEAAKYVTCEECGAPRVRWDLWRQGLEDGQQHLLEDKGNGEKQAAIDCEAREVEAAAAPVDHHA